MIFNVRVHCTRESDLVAPADLVVDPPVPVVGYRDSFGDGCARILAPQGRTRVCADAIVNDTGVPDAVVPHAQQVPVNELPEAALQFLLGSRYCETDRLSETAWSLFAQTPTGWRVFRRSATTCIDTSPSATSTRARPVRRWKPFTTGPASAATTRTSPLPCAGA